MGTRRVRLKTVWLFVVPFVLFARPTPPLLVAGAILAFGGLLFRGLAAGHLRKDEALCVSGPYARTRNPLYLGSLWIGTGITLSGGRIVFVLLFLLFFAWIYRRTIRREEEILEEKFGEAYRRWRAAVPSFFPALRRLRPTSGEAPRAVNRPPRMDRGSNAGGSFAMRRYLRNREWEAALGTLSGFGLLVARMYWGG